MGTAERRERERLALRERIIDEGRQILTSEGYAALTMRKLADRIEYTPGALYAHYPDKDAIVRAICEHDFRAFSAHMAPTAAVEDPIERLLSLARAYATFALERPEPYKLLFVSRPLVKDMSELHENPDTDTYTLLGNAVRYALSRGHFPAWKNDAELIAQTLWAGTHGAVMLEIWRTPEKPMPFEPIERRLDAICEAMIHGLENSKPPTMRPTKTSPAKATAKPVAANTSATKMPSTRRASTKHAAATKVGKKSR